jgi:hypothetical protein
MYHKIQLRWREKSQRHRIYNYRIRGRKPKLWLGIKLLATGNYPPVPQGTNSAREKNTIITIRHQPERTTKVTSARGKEIGLTTTEYGVVAILRWG